MGQLVDGLRVIEEGLAPNEAVVVKGIQRARPGSKVDPKSIEMATLTASALKKEKEAKKKKTTQPEKQENEKETETENSKRDKTVAASEEKPE
jgi:hypothetical protein